MFSGAGGGVDFWWEGNKNLLGGIILGGIFPGGGGGMRKFLAGVHQDQNFYKLYYQFLIKARHVQSTQKRKFVKFLQYIKKKYPNCFCVPF